ncbi:MAG TPA: serine/threonine-protein kinase [Gemmataceae bacterium]|jgi:serine/threonine-protein kinase|nr:serine/threonine-protein kinase [Gemmataceae bacterium]
MTAVATSRIVDALADPRLLAADRYDELVNTLLPRCDDWAILGPELLFRGWLTPYQLDVLMRPKGRPLILGSYVLLEVIGEGGMGQIFRARHAKFDTPAAVKVIRTERAADATTAARFLREIRALGTVRHPGLVHALDADVEHGRLYCAMEYVAGTDLQRLIETSGPLPIETACRYATQVAQALQYVSTLGLVHRDVKPANILVPADGGPVKLVDLGLARFELASPESAAGLTRAGVMIGTPDYASPEQIRDSHTADVRSDLYALGGTLYHMLTGRAPFGDCEPVDKMYHHLCRQPVPVTTLRSDVPAAVATVVHTLLAKRAKDRYQDPAEVVAALADCLHKVGDTVIGSNTPTNIDIPVPQADWALPRTEEIPAGQLTLVTSAAPAAPRGYRHLLIAAALAGLAAGVLVTLM